MGGLLDAKRKLNLERVSILLLEQGMFSQTILSQILRGFGVREIHCARSTVDAKAVAEASVFDLIIIDPTFDAGGGLNFARWLRRASGNKNRFAPMILAVGHSTKGAVSISRDAGANLVIGKPFAPRTLLERIMWVAADTRPYVEIDGYVGPDRRFKNDALPDNSNGMRANDHLIANIEEPAGPIGPAEQPAE